MSVVHFKIAESDYACLIELLDTRIKSERARAAAFRGRRDHSNQMIAAGRMNQLLNLRNALVVGCQSQVDDD